MLERLQVSRDRQRPFVSDAGHELRSPIATIRHELETLLANPDGADMVEVASGLLAEDLRMQDLVENLLVLARSDEGTLALNRRAADVDDLVLAEAFRLRSRRIVTVDTSGVSAGQVLGDPPQLARVVRNLVDNAERHATSLVALPVRERDGRVVLTVDDDGAGIPVEDRTRVFERFTCLDEARARGTGNYGLGLAIVADVVAAHRGTVNVADAPMRRCADAPMCRSAELVWSSRSPPSRRSVRRTVTVCPRRRLSALHTTLTSGRLRR